MKIRAQAHRRRRKRSAFTLTEVLIAMAIFALAAIVLGAAYVNVITSYDVVSRGMQVGEDYEFARQLVLAQSDREKVEEGGEFVTASGRTARWSAEIASTSLPDLFNVTFTCELTEPTRPQPERLVQNFMLLRPTWSTDAAERGKLKEETKTRIAEITGKQRQQ